MVGVLGVGMASGAMAEEPGEVTTGPGAVFDSLNAAAVDALMCAQSNMALSPGRGGAIVAVEGGFSYEQAVGASSREGLQLTLRPESVGWYYAHNYEASVVGNREQRPLSHRDRAMVSEVDPLHRPLYLLTSAKKVIRFDGERVDVVWPRERTAIEDVIAAN
jgi:hypothetical protein